MDAGQNKGRFSQCWPLLRAGKSEIRKLQTRSFSLNKSVTIKFSKTTRNSLHAYKKNKQISKMSNFTYFTSPTNLPIINTSYYYASTPTATFIDHFVIKILLGVVALLIHRRPKIHILEVQKLNLVFDDFNKNTFIEPQLLERIKQQEYNLLVTDTTNLKRGFVNYVYVRNGTSFLSNVTAVIQPIYLSGHDALIRNW